MVRFFAIVSLALHGESLAAGSGATTCGDVKALYKEHACCGNPTKEVDIHFTAGPKKRLPLSANPCAGKKPAAGGGFDNIDCINGAIEQSGGDVTEGYKGGMTDVSGRVPLNTSYFKAGLCPVNVHWHLGAEHRSQGQYDESGKGPLKHGTPANAAQTPRRLAAAGTVRYGYACLHYDANDAKFTEPYKWQHCTGMYVGETYEVHWPHSAVGACGTPYQFQSPFYDGVFCGLTPAIGAAVLGGNKQGLANSVGVQAQIFTIVNDENYYYPDLMRGAIVDGKMWENVTAYTGSTTGTTRDNTKCSAYTPITWQVDRTCHLISASSFDKMCADMKQQADDMSSDLHAHGARIVVSKKWNANNQVETADHSYPTR